MTTHDDLGSASLFVNPATLANFSGFLDLSASQNQFIADITHNTLSMAINPAKGRFGTFGLSAQFVDYGDNFIGTQVAANEDGFIDTGNLSPTALAIGLGYAQSITDRFSVGAQVRVIEYDLGRSPIVTEISQNDSVTTIVENSLNPLAFDFGILYKTGFKSFVFGMAIRNFSEEVEFAQESFQLPLVFSFGFSVNAFDFVNPLGEDQTFIVSVNATSPRSNPENINVGAEYTVKDILALRLGYSSSRDEEGMTYGLGVKSFGIALDYAYTPFGVFDNVQRFTVRFSF
jgi:hypothetical protein